MKSDLSSIKKQYELTKKQHADYDKIISELYVSIRDARNEMIELVKSIDQVLSPEKQPEKQGIFKRLTNAFS